MSTLAAWSYTQSLTIWPLTGENKFGVPTYGTPYIITGTWKEGGGVQTAQSGEEFVATSKYFFEMTRDNALLPELDDYIAIGDLTAEADPIEAGAEKIKKVGSWDMKMFGASEIPDQVIMT